MKNGFRSVGWLLEITAVLSSIFSRYWVIWFSAKDFNYRISATLSIDVDQLCLFQAL